MKKIFIFVLLAIFFLTAFPVKAEEGERVKPDLKIEGTVIGIKTVYVVGQGNVYVIMVDNNGKQEMFMYFRKPEFRVGQRIIFENNRIKTLE